MKQTSFIPKLLPAGASSVSIKELRELTEEESGLRHRLELKVERAFYRAAVALQELSGCQPDDSTHYDLNIDWRNSDKVKRAFEQAAAVLRELCERGLYRETHDCFDHYVRERFGTFVEEYSPMPCSDSKRLCCKN